MNDSTIEKDKYKNILMYRGQHYCYREKFVKNFILLYKLNNLDLLENPDVHLNTQADQAEALKAMENFVNLIESFDIEAIKQQRTRQLRKSSFYQQKSFMRSKVAEKLEGSEIRQNNFLSFLGDSDKGAKSGNSKRDTDRISYDPLLFSH